MSARQSHYDEVSEYMDADGWFPDSILGETFWVLEYCERKVVEGVMFWRFVNV